MSSLSYCWNVLSSVNLVLILQMMRDDSGVFYDINACHPEAKTKDSVTLFHESSHGILHSAQNDIR
jgi:hypothetical protein